MRGFISKHINIIIVILIIILFLVWIIYGGNKTCEFVGLEICSKDEPNKCIEVCDTFTLSSERCFIPNKERTNGKKRSKGEAECIKVMEELFNKEFDTVRPDFLKSPETGRNLELDCYNEELKLAVEYNGRQHYSFPSFPNFTEEQFKEQIRRDAWKLDTCDTVGIYLITVPYTVKLEDIKQFIIDRLPYTLRPTLRK
uniref:Restriction endonuclease n=1 Tax=Pithovirus LCPAC403 TaxID=2506596 RepID=A0A481ZDQ1_9VIRU|nr:MAG: restriction endonuclease [Pithovirus LCPAC403]